MKGAATLGWKHRQSQEKIIVSKCYEAVCGTPRAEAGIRSGEFMSILLGTDGHPYYQQLQTPYREGSSVGVRAAEGRQASRFR